MSYSRTIDQFVARGLQLLLLATCLAAAAAPAHGAETAYLALTADGLEDLGPGWTYEGWLIVDGAPVSTGTFNVLADGKLSRSAFAVEVSSLELASTFVLTIEPVPDADPAPSAVHLLAGNLIGSQAMATVGHPAAIGHDFGAAAGQYILAAPSAGEGGDYRNGIWWLDPGAGPAATFDLPALPAGWVYEGWVVGPSGPMSTGRFSAVDGADSDGAGISSGPFSAPPFPGQDFVTPPSVLTDGYAAVLTVEPEPDNSPSPFTLKPLVDGAIDDVGALVLQPMANMATSFPTMTVTVMDSAIASETAHLQLHFNGLEDLGPGWAYEGWLIVDGSPVSTGTFTVNSNGVPSASYSPTEVESVDAISAFVLTIEPSPDSDPAPSAVHILAGELIDGRARLSVGHAAAVGTDFATAAGEYILAAPSAGGAASYVNGIWWLDPSAGPGPTLELPTLPEGWVYEGWVYEGWVAGSEGPVSTGRFSAVTGADSDGAGPAAGPEPAPGFPGQDFVDPATDLTSGYAAVISVEPEPDNSPAPFTLKPLLDPSIDDVGAMILQPMHRNPAPLPSGSAAVLTETTILAGANVQGVGGVMWMTDLDIANLSDRLAMFTIQLLETGQANWSPQSVSYTLMPGASARYTDVYASVFGFEGTGALRILAETPLLVATSRTAAGGDEGSHGLSMPGHLATRSIGFGETGTLVGLAESSSTTDGSRTNIGLVSVIDQTSFVYVDLYRADGAWVRTAGVTLEPFEHTQLNGVFKEEVDVGYAVVWTPTPGARFFAYATVIDNQSDDPSFIPIQ